MRGASRPAASAAARMIGATCVAIARALAIQRIVPSATPPATRSNRRPSAATSTGTDAPAAAVGAPRRTLNSSPWNSTASPCSNSVRMVTYSSVCRPGVAYDIPNDPSITGSCDGPIPSVNPSRPITATTASTRFAINAGCDE